MLLGFILLFLMEGNLHFIKDDRDLHQSKAQFASVVAYVQGYTLLWPIISLSVVFDYK